MNQMSQLNWEGKDLVFISCEDFRNYISCSSLDLIIVFAVCHDEEVKGLGVRRGNPAHRSFSQDPWLACTAAVHWDQAQTFIFPSLQQASRQIRCTMCQYIGVRKQFGLFCLTTPRSSSWQAGQCLCFTGKVKPPGCPGVFICSSPAGLGEKLQWNSATTWGHEKTWSVGAAPAAQRLSHVFCSDASTNEVNSNKCVWRPFPSGHHTLTSPAFVHDL